MRIERSVVPVLVVARLVRVTGVELTRRGEIVLGVQREGAALVRMRQNEEPSPVVARERALPLRKRAVVLDRAVAREDAAAQEVVARWVGRELEIAVFEPVR